MEKFFAEIEYLIHRYILPYFAIRGLRSALHSAQKYKITFGRKQRGQTQIMP